jgi:Tfp pilus assembly protein FimT
MHGKRRSGFSMLETLVVLAIIMVLLTLLVPVLTKALRMAKATAAGEEMRSDRVGEMATAIHEGNNPKERTPEEWVQHARGMFRREGKGGQTKLVSDVLFVVANDPEFRAYWHTLLNKQNTQLPEFTRKGHLIAFTPEGERFELLPVEKNSSGPAHIIRWEFISTRLEETGRMDLGGNVIYSDGRREYVAYPREFPMTRQVAELSHRFYMEHIF